MPTGDILWLLLPEFVSALLIAAAAFALFRLGATVERGLASFPGVRTSPM